ncbi:hypothetical protein ISF79_01375 [Burkholderia pseudomallei]|nr:hypothetical protein [Burkholderia pseudomallei]
MGRLEEVREEIEQLCEEIERDALVFRLQPLANSATAPNAYISLHFPVPRDMSRRLRINISIEQDDDSGH